MISRASRYSAINLGNLYHLLIETIKSILIVAEEKAEIDCLPGLCGRAIYYERDLGESGSALFEHQFIYARL